MTYVTVKKLIDTGRWTEALIARFLGDPDDYAPNPKNPDWAPMRLYSVQRVDAVEWSREFRAASQERYLRRKAQGLLPGMTRKRTPKT